MSDSLHEYYSISPEALSKLFESDGIRNGKSLAMLQEWDGITGLCKLIESDVNHGICEDAKELSKRAHHFGDNRPHIYHSQSFFHFLIEPLQDTVLRILIGAAFISLIVGAIEEPDQGWIEGIAILVTVCIVCFVTAINDYKKEAQFIKLNLQTDICNLIVIRDGIEKEIHQKDLMTGDLLCVATGDILAGDGIYLRGSGLSIDESSITGESKLVKKLALIHGHEKSNDPFLVSGSKIIEGSGVVLILAIGPHSVTGKNRRMMSTLVDEPDTPLQERLTLLAEFLGKIGLYGALLLTVALLLHLFIAAGIDKEWGSDQWKLLIDAFILGITILVVAIPEGLPLALTLSMAYSILRMKKEQIFVRHLKGCEVMGAATNILSDKTGTLTQNKMTVTKAFLLGESYDNSECSTLSLEEKKIIAEAIARNTTAFINVKDGKKEMVGNRTEGALLMMCQDWKQDYHFYRNTELSKAQFAFNPRTKRMTTVYEPTDGEVLVYTKGAGEVILDICEDELLNGGERRKLTDERKWQIIDVINEYAGQSLRVISLAYRKTTWKGLEIDDKDAGINQAQAEKGLTFLGLVGIEDPLRPESRNSVKKCLVAGVTVRMVTGDSAETAKRIAKSCAILPHGVLDDELDNYVMEGSKFREKVGGLVTVTNTEGKVESFKVGNMEAFKEVAPRLRVIARCSPEDKLLFVIGLKEMGEVVGVTGDGSNDAPALKQSDIGLAMMSGTPLAKESSDIILLDDNFESVVNSVKWGRNVYASIRKFLTFQMTCNAVALAISIIGAITVSDSPLSAVQMLWVNLIMDALAALALATEPPTDELFYTKPFGRTEKMITKDMWISMATQMVYQCTILFIFLYDGPNMLDIEEGYGHEEWSQENGTHFTLIFHTFVMCQVFNEINCRKLSLTEINVFRGFFNNPLFLGIMAVTTIVQLLLVQYGGNPVKVSGLSFEHHLICTAFASGCLVVSLITRLTYKAMQKKERVLDEGMSPLILNPY
ncbi:unnamed protein product [Blepharisma stoltei]|uniref:P-type Ca(2+) transporter n=1 Tax=Blepharisma stoltei TaxID=1481888 RepID=A0AAU9IKP6_9CILI|nr:unnamed protein product [Blepharisma stoltei]